jgi:hypothetical protein
MAQKYALFDENRVRLTHLIEGLHTIPKKAVPITDELFMRMVEETDGVWVLGNKNEIRKDPLPPLQPDYPKLIASVRFRHETAGIEVDGNVIDTSREGQAQLMGAALHATVDPDYVCTWKAVSGPVEMTAAQLIATARSVRTHVQACFDRETALLNAVANGDFSDDMLNEGWPA